MPTPYDRLLGWHRDGQLAARYPDVATLLAELPAEQLPRAGQILARLDVDDVLRHHPHTPVVTVAITGHGTVAPVVPALTAELARHRLVLRPHVMDFGGYVLDLSDPTRPLHALGADVVLCVLDPMMIFDEVPTPWRVRDVERILEDKLRLLEGALARFGATSRATLVLNTVPLPRRFTSQLVDYRSRSLLGAAWREANAHLLRLPEQHPTLVVVDLDPLIEAGGAAADIRLSQYTRCHLSAGLLADYAREVGHLIRHLTGQTKKALALDLDGTVWGGVLAEDGPEGIEVAGSYRGEAFRTFQRTVKQLTSQGVLLAAVTKNDLGPVRTVLAEHPEMTLHEDDFVRVSATWHPKPNSIIETAEALNLTVDSFVFADDSAFECGLVRHELPQVATVQLDDEPALYGHRLLHDGWFDTRELTVVDSDRPARYRAETARGDFRHTCDSMEDYLRALRVRVRVGTVREQDVSRVSQITLRTNQFNLTATRLQPTDVRALAADPTARVLTIHSGDRFGNHGLVGAVFLRRSADTVHIDNFVLSCRVFSRGIEQACLHEILRRAQAAGAAVVRGVYRPSAKNAGVRDFYPRHGFRDIADDEQFTFQHDLTEIMPPPGHVELTASVEGEPL